MNAETQGLACEEAHHRFFNTLTRLGILLRQHFAEFEDPPVQDAVAIFEAQILAFAGVQRTLQTSPNCGALDVPTHFGRLCAQLASVQLAPQGFACELFADEGEMDTNVGEKLGLIIAELVTNAAKHAFRDRTSGLVSIALRRDAGGWTCAVRDNGIGVGRGSGGSGLRLIEDLAEEIGAQVFADSHEGSTLVIVSLPDPPQIVVRPDVEIRRVGAP